MKAQIFIDSVVLWQGAHTILLCSWQQEEHSEANQRVIWAMLFKKILLLFEKNTYLVTFLDWIFYVQRNSKRNMDEQTKILDLRAITISGH